MVFFFDGGKMLLSVLFMVIFEDVLEIYYLFFCYSVRDGIMVCKYGFVLVYD